MADRRSAELEWHERASKTVVTRKGDAYEFNPVWINTITLENPALITKISVFCSTGITCQHPWRIYDTFMVSDCPDAHGLLILTDKGYYQGKVSIDYVPSR